MDGAVATARRWCATAGVLLLVGCAAAPTGSSSGAQAASQTPSEPVVLADGVISTAAEEYRISFTPDGSTAYFARSEAFFPQSRQATIMEAHLVDGTWSEPAVAEFSGTHPDIDPWVSPDGASIYFSSIRPVDGTERSDVELFRVDRDGDGDGWGEPVHLADLGSPGDELGASVDANGTVWFASDRPGGAGGWDIYSAERTDGGHAAPQPAAINSAVWEFNPAIDAAGTALVFTSIAREDASGLGDLYLTSAVGDTWSDAAPLTVNTGSDEYHASRSPDGQSLFFVRRAGQGDLHVVAWSAARPAAP
jgi:Tol biopolymer transport system component